MRQSSSLRALLSGLIDYAGLYPPAQLDFEQVIENYERYLASPERWMLNRLVLPVSKLEESQPGSRWRITLLADGPVANLDGSVEAIETKTPLMFPLPVYRELPLEQIQDGWAKLRTGALTPERIPSSTQIASFLHAAAARRLAFKATAGLHHPFRSEQALTYATNSPRAVAHGFINLFTAAAFAWYGAGESMIADVLETESPQAFRFTDSALYWHDLSLSVNQIETARAVFAHSFGSCSFEEPIADLQALGLLD